eukprot:Awhi_evm1s11807
MYTTTKSFVWIIVYVAVIASAVAKNFTVSNLYPTTGSCAACEAGATIGFERRNSYISPELVTLEQKINDDQGNPTLGLELNQNMIHADKSVALMGAWNSAVTLALGRYLSFKGMPTISISSSPELADPVNFPT